jgi:hypothetical protein
MQICYYPKKKFASQNGDWEKLRVAVFLAASWLISGCPLLIFEGKQLSDSHQTAINQL